MNPKLRLILLNNSKKTGFALPITLILGLIMLLVGMGMVIRSQSDQSKVLAQKDTAVGLSLAEVGISRYQDLMNKNKFLAMYPECINTPDANTHPCNEVPQSEACQSDAEISSLQEQLGTGWKNVYEGQYKLVTYAYTPTPGQAPGTGTLTLEGRIKQNNIKAVATSRVEVKIPIEPSNPEDFGIPGVWLTSGGTGGNTLQADVLLNDCSTSLSSIHVQGTDPDTNQPYQAKHTTLEFPELPTRPTFPVTDPRNLGTLSGEDYTFPRRDAGGNIIDTPTQRTMTRDGQTVQTNVYEYLVDGIDLQAGNHSLTIEPGAKVIFYLSGNIERGGDIEHSCVDNSNHAIPNCHPTDFQIFGYGDNPGTTTDSICTHGNKRIEAFILAPSYSIGVAGSGGGQGGIKGAVWANQWSNNGGCGSNTSNVVVVQTARWEDIGLEPRNMPPKILKITDWKRREIP